MTPMEALKTLRRPGLIGNVMLPSDGCSSKDREIVRGNLPAITWAIRVGEFFKCAQI